MFKNPLQIVGPALAALPRVALVVLLAACARPEPGAEFNDPYEAQNRAVHEANVELDRVIFRGKPDRKPFLPAPLARGFRNVASNLGVPSDVLNSLLQVRPGPALNNAARFVVNTTVGIGGIFDPASAIGLTGRDTDFGETLHVWGAPEGAFLVLPVAGPTTERDLAGSVVDLFIDPLNVLDEPERYYALGLNAAGGVAARDVYNDLIDEIFYKSADSYAQMRLLYLQNRHFKLGIEADVQDPYEDPYGQ